MKVVTLLLLILSFECDAEAEAYVLLGAQVEPSTSKQPTWIALRGGNRLIHIPAGGSIAKVEPGRYRVMHIDFQKRESSGLGTVSADDESGILSFEALPNVITYVGNIELTRSGGGMEGRRYDVRIISTPDLLSRACDANPEAFTRFQARLVDENGSFQSIWVRCET